MRRSRWGVLALGGGTVGAVLLAMRGLSGCYSAVPNDGLKDAGPTKVVEGGVGDVLVGPGAACDAAVGEVPAGNCFDGTLTCTPSTTCNLGTEAACGNPKTCQPMTQNVAPIYNFRMESLYITAPSTLTEKGNPLVYGTVASGVTLNAPQCGYGPVETATGAFSWLISVDKTTNKVTTGGGVPTTDPYTTGYCFETGTFGSSAVGPIELSATFNGNTFSTAPFPEVLNIPIFASLTMTTNPIILPLLGTRFENVGISTDGNCIGDINPEWAGFATSTCNKPSYLGANCPRFFTNGALAGYIKLEDANKIVVPLTMPGTVCSLLLSSPSNPGISLTAPCPASAYNLGNYCSSPPGPGGCKDSMWLSATFSANAVKINESCSK
jgi:hypothetical protein